MNRKMMRASKSEGRKLIKKGWDTFVDCTREAIEKCDLLQGIKPNGLDKIFKNNIYTVQVFYYWLSTTGESRCGKKLMIRRNDGEPVHNWSSLQRIKNEICGEEYTAVEVYPAQKNLVDEANMYWLWVYPSETTCPFEMIKEIKK